MFTASFERKADLVALVNRKLLFASIYNSSCFVNVYEDDSVSYEKTIEIDSGNSNSMFLISTHTKLIGLGSNGVLTMYDCIENMKRQSLQLTMKKAQCIQSAYQSRNEDQLLFYVCSGEQALKVISLDVDYLEKLSPEQIITPFSTPLNVNTTLTTAPSNHSAMQPIAIHPEASLLAVISSTGNLHLYSYATIAALLLTKNRRGDGGGGGKDSNGDDDTGTTSKASPTVQSLIMIAQLFPPSESLSSTTSATASKSTATATGDNQKCTQVSISPRGDLLVAVFGPSTVCVYDIRTPTLLTRAASGGSSTKGIASGGSIHTSTGTSAMILTPIGVFRGTTTTLQSTCVCSLLCYDMLQCQIYIPILSFVCPSHLHI